VHLQDGTIQLILKYAAWPLVGHYAQEADNLLTSDARLLYSSASQYVLHKSAFLLKPTNIQHYSVNN